MSELPRSAPVSCIVMGASAGGIEALTHLLPSMPSKLNAPVCIVMHLPPHGESLLSQIFSAQCPLTVKEVEDGEPLVNGTVYFAAPNYHFLIEAGPRVALNVDEPVNYSRPSIDLLFQSAVDVFGAGTCGVLLSGSNADGAQGLQEIHQAGGIAIIQDPAEAQSPAMGLAAMALLPGHPVMRLKQIAFWLAQLSRHPDHAAGPGTCNAS